MLLVWLGWLALICFGLVAVIAWAAGDAILSALYGPFAFSWD